MAAVSTNYTKNIVVGNQRGIEASVAAMSNGDTLATGLSQVSSVEVTPIDAGLTTSDQVAVAPATTGPPLGSGTTLGQVAFKVNGTGRAVIVRVLGV